FSRDWSSDVCSSDLYEPIQPVPFPHDIHVSQLGMDCRYCHSFVDVAAQSNVPNTQTCMACHQQVQKDNPKLEPVRDSWKTGKPIEWVWLHRTVDYVYYNHAAHVNRGISCFSCHGAVNHMPVVYMAKPHSMAWCLECHRDVTQQIFWGAHAPRVLAIAPSRSPAFTILKRFRRGRRNRHARARALPGGKREARVSTSTCTCFRATLLAKRR